MSNLRDQWRKAYSEARRRGATGRQLAECVCDGLGQPRTSETFWGEHGPAALAFQRCLADARRPVLDLGQQLAVDVLNGFGTKNASRYMYEYRSRAWNIADRGRQLRDRMRAAGRLRLDRGGWVREVVA